MITFNECLVSLIFIISIVILTNYTYLSNPYTYLFGLVLLCICVIQFLTRDIIETLQISVLLPVFNADLPSANISMPQFLQVLLKMLIRNHKDEGKAMARDIHSLTSQIKNLPFKELRYCFDGDFYLRPYLLKSLHHPVGVLPSSTNSIDSICPV